MINTRKLSVRSIFLFAMTTCSLTYPQSPTPVQDLKKSSEVNITLPATEPRTISARKRKKHPKQEKEKKIYTYRDMSYEQLLIAKDQQVAANNVSVAIKYLEQLVQLAADVTQKSEHLLQIADLLYAEGIFEKAALLYTEFSTLYLGSDKIEYALAQSIKSCEKCLLSSDRDQTKTEETLALAELFLSNDRFITYKDEVSRIRAECQNKLIESELSICSYYLTRQNFKTVDKRLKKLRTKWLPLVPTIEPQLIAFETDMTQQKEAVILAQQEKIDAATQKAESKSVKLAHNKKTKSMTERF
jgi:outer membrane protein assembly factor BamD (BamD/ComL family)